MDTRHWLIFALGGVCLCVATWLACRWWYGRKLDAANHRLQKLEKARLFSTQQTLQARKQVEALQKDLAEQQETMAQVQVERQRSRHLEAALKDAADAESEAQSEALGRRPSHGFADTQPMA
jgi:biopolymer transport protein ExbB/TolQ